MKPRPQTLIACLALLLSVMVSACNRGDPAATGSLQEVKQCMAIATDLAKKFDIPARGTPSEAYCACVTKTAMQDMDRDEIRENMKFWGRYMRSQQTGDNSALEDYPEDQRTRYIDRYYRAMDDCADVT